MSFAELWEKLCSGDETYEIEAKRASDVSKSILETISALLKHRLAERGLPTVVSSVDNRLPTVVNAVDKRLTTESITNVNRIRHGLLLPILCQEVAGRGQRGTPEIVPAATVHCVAGMACLSRNCPQYSTATLTYDGSTI